MLKRLKEKLLRFCSSKEQVGVKSRRYSEADAELRYMLTAYRAHLRRCPSSGPNRHCGPARARFAKKKSRAILKNSRRGKRTAFPRNLLVKGRYSENRLASGLMHGRKTKWVPVLKRKQQEKYNQLILKDFNFIDCPQETIDQLQEILHFEANAISALLHFDDEYCVDVSAYLALSDMWPAMAKVFQGGRMSVPIQKVVETLRLRRDLGMKLPDLNNVDDIWAFPRRVRRVSGGSKSDDRHLEPQSRERVADEFCDALDQWLGMASEEIELTKSGKARFAQIIGELLDNAERHSNPPGNDGGWSTAAFMARRMEGGAEVFRCHMGFLSIGASIAESLNTGSIAIRAQIRKYVDKHLGCGISDDTLTTLVGLQDGITRDRAASENERGGVGLQEVLELINVLGVTTNMDKGPRMTIVSGRSCIKARTPYLVGKRAEEYGPRMLWFNDDNSPEFPPDKEFVFDLNSHFPGTIIGLTFVLSKQDLMAVLNATDRAN